MNTTIESGLENITRVFNPAGQVLITEGLRLKGDLGFSKPGTMEGQLEGTLFSDHQVIVGESATIKGGITAEGCTILGKVEGQLVIRTELEIPKNGEVRGTIKAGSLKVEPGAQFAATLNIGGLSPVTPSTWNKVKDWFQDTFRKSK